MNVATGHEHVHLLQSQVHPIGSRLQVCIHCLIVLSVVPLRWDCASETMLAAAKCRENQHVDTQSIQKAGHYLGTPQQTCEVKSVQVCESLLPYAAESCQC